MILVIMTSVMTVMAVNIVEMVGVKMKTTLRAVLKEMRSQDLSRKKKTNRHRKSMNKRNQ